MAKSKRDPADELRSVPPRDFVAARKALAARLTQQGEPAEARRVARLPRPGPAAWALNRAAGARPRELAALAEAVDRLRRAQLGQGDLRAATEAYRTAFEPLVRAAREALKGAGTKASAALDRRLRGAVRRPHPGRVPARAPTWRPDQAHIPGRDHGTDGKGRRRGSRLPGLA